MVQMNLFEGQEVRHRCREWSCGPEGGQRESGTNRDSGTDIFTIMCEAAVQHRELKPVLCDDLEGWDGGVGVEAQKGGDLCVHIADSQCCTAGMNTTL